MMGDGSNKPARPFSAFLYTIGMSVSGWLLKHLQIPLPYRNVAGNGNMVFNGHGIMEPFASHLSQRLRVIHIKFKVRVPYRNRNNACSLTLRIEIVRLYKIKYIKITIIQYS